MTKENFKMIDPNFIPVKDCRTLMNISNILSNSDDNRTITNLLYQILVRLDYMNNRDEGMMIMNKPFENNTQIDNEETLEILHEYMRAIAGLAGEELVPCVNGCIGHLGREAKELFDNGLKIYKRIMESKKTSLRNAETLKDRSGSMKPRNR
jgi:hypothetical protein